MSLTPKEWKSFQHYKERRPPWIKLHRPLLDNVEFQRMPVASRALAPMLWLVAAEYENGEITADMADIAWRLRMPLNEFQDALKPLIDKGFFSSSSNASDALAECNQETRPEREAETQEQTETKGGGDEPKPRASSKSLITQGAFDLTDEILIAMGKTADDPLSIGGPYTVQSWLSSGVSRDAIMLGVKTAMVRKQHDPPSTFKYFEKAVYRAAAELSRPPPKIEVKEAEIITVTSHGKPKSAIIQAADNLIARIASFDDAGSDELCGDQGENAPRLLSHG